MLTILSFLQYYWLYMFYDMFARFLKKGIAEDIQNDIRKTKT
jgi:hypothetical protein